MGTSLWGIKFRPPMYPLSTPPLHYIFSYPPRSLHVPLLVQLGVWGTL